MVHLVQEEILNEFIEDKTKSTKNGIQNNKANQFIEYRVFILSKGKNHNS